MLGTPKTDSTGAKKTKKGKIKILLKANLNKTFVHLHIFHPPVCLIIIWTSTYLLSAPVTILPFYKLLSHCIFNLMFPFTFYAPPSMVHPSGYSYISCLEGTDRRGSPKNSQKSRIIIVGCHRVVELCSVAVCILRESWWELLSQILHKQSPTNDHLVLIYRDARFSW